MVLFSLYGNTCIAKEFIGGKKNGKDQSYDDGFQKGSGKRWHHSGKRNKNHQKDYPLSFLALFSSVDDVRVQKLIDYPLNHIILIAFLSVLGGANTWQEMTDFGNCQSRWLSKFLDVKKYGIPPHSVKRFLIKIAGIISELPF